MKVYAITSGDYEDSHTWAIAISLESAVQHIKESRPGWTWEEELRDFTGGEWELRGCNDPEQRYPTREEFTIVEMDLIGS